MLKKILTTAYLLTLTTTPTQALPIWAEAIARDHCEYLDLGAEWDDSIEQALRDNRHWIEEMNANPMASKATFAAIVNRCGELDLQMFREYKARQETQPAIDTQWR